MQVCLHSLMDRTAVSGTAGTGSIPVGGAKIISLFAFYGKQVCLYNGG